MMESQLQLVVKCYKRMCQILGEELRKNPTALDAIVKEELKEEPKEVAVATTKLNISIKLPNEEKKEKQESGDASSVSLKEAAVSTTVTKTAVLPTAVDDPIAEIVREVENGTKVSRAVLWIKPPSKYLNSKVAAPPRVVSKKEVTPTVPDSSSSLTVSTEALEGEDVQCRDDTPKHRLETKKKKGKLALKLEGAHKGTKSKALHIKNSVCKTERAATVVASTRRKLRKPVTSSIQSNLPQRRATTRAGSKGSMTKPVSKASKKVANKETKPAAVPPEVPEPPPSPPPPQTPKHFIYGDAMKASVLDVSVHSFNDKYLNMTSVSLALLPHAQPANVLASALSRFPLAPGEVPLAKKTSFLGGEWQKSTRKRRWDPLCPSVVVKRPREVIAKMLLLQSKAAKAKRKMRYNKAKQRKQASEQPKKPAAKPRCPESVPPPPYVAALHPLPRHHATTSPLSCHPGDIPLPDNIPILPNDASQLDDDINWKELSDFLESNDEESMASLPPPLSRYGPPHQQHPAHLEFDERYRPRHLMPPPFMASPHHPGHLHLPPPPRAHLPGPHTPVMPFTPDMRHPPPDGYFSPMMRPEDFLPGGGGMGPDGGGYSSPMTPHRGYPTGGMCPMEFQHSPHHHHHGHFPMPSPRMSNFVPPRRSFPAAPPLPVPAPKQPKGSRSNGKSNSSSNGGTMSKMVTKMKMKSPGGQQRKKPPTPGTPGEQGKKRRSPGYSEAGWRCRCGTNNVMFPDKVCAKGKCPCYTKGVACKNCLCRHCHNPFGLRESSTSASSPADAVISE